MGNFKKALENHAFPESAKIRVDLNFNVAGLKEGVHAADIFVTNLKMEGGRKYKRIAAPNNMQLRILKPNVSTNGKKFANKHGAIPPQSPYNQIFAKSVFPEMNSALKGAVRTFENDEDYDDYRKLVTLKISEIKTSLTGQIFILKTQLKKNDTNFDYNISTPIIVPSTNSMKQVYDYYKKLVKMDNKQKARQLHKKHFENIEVNLGNITKKNYGSTIEGDISVRGISFGKLYFVTIPFPVATTQIPPPENCIGDDFETVYRNFKFNKNQLDEGEINSMLNEFANQLESKLEEGCQFKLVAKGYGSASEVDTTFTNPKYKGSNNEQLAKTRAEEIADEAIDYLANRFLKYIKNGQLNIIGFNSETNKYKVKIAPIPKGYNGNEGFRGRWISGDPYYKGYQTTPEALAFREKWRFQGKLQDGTTGYFLTKDAKKHFRQWQITMLRVEYVPMDEEFEVINV